jgi:hypothetical protein
VYIIPQLARIYHFFPKSLAKLPDFAPAASNHGEKLPNLRLRCNAPGTPLPWPILAKKIEAVKTAISPSTGAFCRWKPVQGAA